MDGLKDILRKYTNTLHLAGGDEMPTFADAERSQLQAALTALSKRNNTLFRVCAIIAIIAFIFVFGLLIYLITEPTKIQIILGPTGVSAIFVSLTGLLAYMNKIWKEKISTDILLALVGTLKADVINSVVTALLAKI